MTFALDIVDRGMVQRLHERSDIDNSGRAIVGHILHVQDVISRAANSAFKQHGLNYSVYVVLATLKASGTLYRMSLSKLVETLLLASGRISNLLAKLARKGCIKRLTDPPNGPTAIRTQFSGQSPSELRHGESCGYGA